MDRNAKRSLFLILIAFFIAEMTLVKYDAEFGLVLYSIFLAFSLLLMIFRELKTDVKNCFFIIIVIPLMRFISSLLPIEELSFPLRIITAYTVMALTALIVLRKIKIGSLHENRYNGLIPAVILAGLFFGWVEFNILKPSPAFDYISIGTFSAGIAIMVFTGIVEEFIFRGLIQNIFSRIFKITIAIALSNVIFVIMHVVWMNFFELLFVFSIGILCGAIYYKTKNLILVSLLHGMINFSLFVLAPLMA